MERIGDEFDVTLKFDENGELYDVVPINPGREYKVEKLTTLRDLNFYQATVVLYGHGSPGYTVYKTTDGYIIVRKPQP